MWFATLTSVGSTIRAASRMLAEEPPGLAVEQHIRFVAREADGDGVGEVTVWVVLRMRAGLIVRLDLFEEREPATAALGTGAA